MNPPQERPRIIITIDYANGGKQVIVDPEDTYLIVDGRVVEAKQVGSVDSDGTLFRYPHAWGRPLYAAVDAEGEQT